MNVRRGWAVVAVVVTALAAALPLSGATASVPTATAQSGARILGTLGGYGSVALDINTLGQITGYAVARDDSNRAFRWTVSGGMQDLGARIGNPEPRV